MSGGNFTRYQRLIAGSFKTLRALLADSFGLILPKGWTECSPYPRKDSIVNPCFDFCTALTEAVEGESFTRTSPATYRSSTSSTDPESEPDGSITAALAKFNGNIPMNNDIINTARVLCLVLLAIGVLPVKYSGNLNATLQTTNQDLIDFPVEKISTFSIFDKTGSVQQHTPSSNKAYALLNHTFIH